MDSLEENGNNKDRRTKTQLLDELAEVNESLEQSQAELSACHKELIQAKIKIKSLELGEEKSTSLDREMERVQLNLNKMFEDLNRMQETIEKLKSQNDDIKKENEDMKLQLSASQERLAKCEEKATEQQKTVKKQKKDFETEIQQFREQIGELNKKIAQEYVAAPKANFRIEITPSDDNYRTVIHHPLSKDYKVIEGLNMEMILQFITKYLPKLEEPNGESEIQSSPPILKDETKTEEINITEEKKDIILQPQLKSIKKNKILKEVRIKQANYFLENGQNILPNQDFSVHCLLQLPAVPSIKNIDIDTTSYNIRVVVKDIMENRSIFAKDIADDLSYGVVDYETAIIVPRLTSGRYSIFVNAIVPFVRTGDQKIIELEVKN